MLMIVIKFPPGFFWLGGNTRIDLNRLVGVVWEEGVYETGVVQYTDIGKEAEINENTKIGTNTQIQTHKYWRKGQIWIKITKNGIQLQM